MINKTSYKTVKHKGEAEFVEKKSRFIANVYPVKAEEEAISLIADIRSKYYDATHNVYAYSLRDGNISRFSDDGEPGGTAGLPVMEIINKEEITDVLVVVTRYFGGTLLGSGGLVRAYSKTAKLGITDAEIAEKRYSYHTEITTSYDLLGKLRYIIENGNYTLDDIIYNEEITIRAYVLYDEIEKFKKEIVDKTGGKSEVKIIGERYA